MSDHDAAELGEALGHIRSALYNSRSASQGYVAIFSAPERGEMTGTLFETLSHATHTLVRAEQECYRLLTALLDSDDSTP